MESELTKPDIVLPTLSCPNTTRMIDMCHFHRRLFSSLDMMNITKNLARLNDHFHDMFIDMILSAFFQVFVEIEYVHGPLMTLKNRSLFELRFREKTVSLSWEFCDTCLESFLWILEASSHILQFGLKFCATCSNGSFWFCWCFGFCGFHSSSFFK